MSLYSIAPGTSPVTLRTFRSSDARATEGLMRQGQSLVGSVPTAVLTPEVAEADYFAQPPNHLWVADADGLVVGLAGLKHEQPMIARLSLLCIDDDWEDADVAERLVHAAIRHCHHFGYLKLVTETAWPKSSIINLFARCGLRYTRHRGDMDDPTCLLEFYVDLYHRHGGHASIDAVVAQEDPAVTAN